MSQPIPDANWSRWIFASLAKFFNDQKSELPFYIEGQIRETSVVDFGELRTDGPYYTLLNRNLWKVDILCAILVEIVQDDNDLYKLDRTAGIFTKAFHLDIPVYRYGDQENLDDGTQLGCLTMAPERGQRIRMTKFGQVKPATRVAQASIEANYRMYLTRSIYDGSD